MLKTEGDQHVIVTRRFAAAPETVYRAHIEPALIKKWMLGPDGWTMPVCNNNYIETTFDPDGNGTLMTIRMTLPDAGTRAAMLATGRERGMEAGYFRLEGLILCVAPPPTLP